MGVNFQSLQWDLDGTCPDQIDGAILGSTYFGSSEFSGDLTLENDVIILDQSVSIDGILKVQNGGKIIFKDEGSRNQFKM